ncbi:MAG: hypothetical protein WC650_02335 [Candidatus Doudnabacteria bacterium]
MSKTPREIVLAAYKYLADITPPTQKISEVRIEEFVPVGSGIKKKWMVVLSYDNIGEFPFDKKREYKEFEITDGGEVVSMKDKKSRKESE